MRGFGRDVQSEKRLTLISARMYDIIIYVITYRKGIAATDEYYMVSGLVANDQTMPTFTLFLDGFYVERDAILVFAIFIQHVRNMRGEY